LLVFKYINTSITKDRFG